PGCDLHHPSQVIRHHGAAVVVESPTAHDARIVRSARVIPSGRQAHQTRPGRCWIAVGIAPVAELRRRPPPRTILPAGARRTHGVRSERAGYDDMLTGGARGAGEDQLLVAVVPPTPYAGERIDRARMAEPS